MILMLSDPQQDAHLAPVAAELFRRGEEYCLYNPAAYPYAATLTVDGSAGRVGAHLTWEGGAVELSTVKSVWYRRPGGVQASNRLRPEEAAWLEAECNLLLRGTWATMDALWVSRPDRIRQASLKLLQLRLAMELGFRVPRFIVTNDVGRATAFLAAAPDGVVVKVLGTPAVFNEERGATLYTHLITAADHEHLEAVGCGPTFLQEFIRKREDVRVTVIGDALFAAGIDSATAEVARVDFRRAEVFDLPHRPIELPEPVKAACLTLVRRLGLQFGAIDLLLTPAGDYVFLEINPNGQWLWIEMVLGLPLTGAMCDLLARRSGSRA